MSTAEGLAALTRLRLACVQPAQQHRALPQRTQLHTQAQMMAHGTDDAMHPAASAQHIPSPQSSRDSKGSALGVCAAHKPCSPLGTHAAGRCAWRCTHQCVLPRPCTPPGLSHVPATLGHPTTSSAATSCTPSNPSLRLQIGFEIVYHQQTVYCRCQQSGQPWAQQGSACTALTLAAARHQGLLLVQQQRAARITLPCPRHRHARSVPPPYSNTNSQEFGTPGGDTKTSRSLMSVAQEVIKSQNRVSSKPVLSQHQGMPLLLQSYMPIGQPILQFASVLCKSTGRHQFHSCPAINQRNLAQHARAQSAAPRPAAAYSNLPLPSLHGPGWKEFNSKQRRQMPHAPSVQAREQSPQAPGCTAPTKPIRQPHCPAPKKSVHSVLLNRVVLEGAAARSSRLQCPLTPPPAPSPTVSINHNQTSIWCHSQPAFLSSACLPAGLSRGRGPVNHPSSQGAHTLCPILHNHRAAAPLTSQPPGAGAAASTRAGKLQPQQHACRVGQPHHSAPGGGATCTARSMSSRMRKRRAMAGRTSSACTRPSRKGSSLSSSVSPASSYHDSMGMPLSTWKPKACGELSTMAVARRSRPSTVRSFR
mmetsp:Transcript_7272/g.17999  ORF Transcript_7272/g.17999 Transcript_7272/m.17999 type:complete len:590 (-) Transcript_7272:1641-3410(-)